MQECIVEESHGIAVRIYDLITWEKVLPYAHCLLLHIQELRVVNYLGKKFHQRFAGIQTRFCRTIYLALHFKNSVHPEQRSGVLMMSIISLFSIHIHEHKHCHRHPNGESTYDSDEMKTGTSDM